MAKKAGSKKKAEETTPEVEETQQEEKQPKKGDKMNVQMFADLNGFSTVDKSAVMRKYRNEQKTVLQWSKELKGKIDF